jgi:pectate lyase
MKPIPSSRLAMAATWMSLVGATAFAATTTINIRGYVYDASTNAALSGAAVALKANSLSGTTDSKGYYDLQQTTGILPSASLESEGPVRLDGSLLTYTIPEGQQEPVSISFSDLMGRGKSLLAGNVAGGTHTMDLTGKVTKPGVYILRTVVGENRSAHTLQVLKGGRITSMETVVAARAEATAWDTLTVIKSGYTTQKIVLATATDSVAKVLLLSTSGIPFNASLNAPVEGFANVGTAITGGGTATATTVTTCAQLLAAAADKNPRVIKISGTITTSDCNGGYGLPISSNKTIIGVDKKAEVRGGLYMNSGVTNIIIRNLNCHGIYPNSGADDALHVQGATHIWLDHLNIWDATDGNLDITEMADYVTVSWCKFWYTYPDHPHRLCALIGSGGGDHPDDWGKLHVTYHHNWFSTLVNERMPRLMYGTAHVYNDYYTSTGNLYCIGVGSYGQALIENNYFKGVNSPHLFMYDVYAWITARNNVYDNTTGNKDVGYLGSRKVSGQDFSPVELKTAPYTYTLDKAADVPNLVGTYAGPQ